MGPLSAEMGGSAKDCSKKSGAPWELQGGFALPQKRARDIYSYD